MTDRELAVMIKSASTDMEKQAVFGKLLIGGLVLAPVLQGWLQQQQQKAYMRGSTAMSNMLTPMMYAKQNPTGALGLSPLRRNQYDLTPLS